MRSLVSSSVHKFINSLTSTESLLHGNAARSLTTSLPRFYSIDDAKPEETTPTEAESPTETPSQDAEKQPAASQGPTQEDLIAQGYTKRQAAWLQPDPEKQKHFMPRLSRKERGSYAGEIAATQFSKEVELYPKAPEVPLYNLRDVVPEMTKPMSVKFELMKALREANPNASIEELAGAAGLVTPRNNEENSGERGKSGKRGKKSKDSSSVEAKSEVEPILEWEIRLIMSPAAAGEPHPANKKAKCRVHLRALQRQCSLSDVALERIAEIAGPRYNNSTGVLTLTSEKYKERELNREHIRGMLRGLVEEGRKIDSKQNIKKASM